MYSFRSSAERGSRALRAARGADSIGEATRHVEAHRHPCFGGCASAEKNHRTMFQRHRRASCPMRSSCARVKAMPASEQPHRDPRDPLDAVAGCKNWHATFWVATDASGRGETPLDDRRQHDRRRVRNTGCPIRREQGGLDRMQNRRSAYACLDGRVLELLGPAGRLDQPLFAGWSASSAARRIGSR